MDTCAQYPPFTRNAADSVATLGEVALLARIRNWLGDASPLSPQGIGDDCAVWPHPPQGAQLIFTTDAVVYGRHFDATCPPALAAAKLLKRNLSDIAAMGGTPHSALLALTLPRNLSLHWLEQFYLGLRECSLHYATPVTGGDITEGTDNFFAAHITLIGHAKRPLLRTGAKVGDHLFVTGSLGGSIHGHHLHFEPRLPEGRWLAAQPDVRSMIDITDGLAKDLPELLEAEAASPQVVVRQAHAQAEGQRSPLAGGEGGTTAEVEADLSHVVACQTEADGQTAVPKSVGIADTVTAAIAVALLDLTALPLTTAAQSTAVTAQAKLTHPTATDATALLADTATAKMTDAAGHSKPLPQCATDGAPAETTGCNTLPPAIARALTDGEDYELLFTVDGQTDPAEFIARWQHHFSQTEPPGIGTPSSPQPAYPYHIGQIAAAPRAGNDNATICTGSNAGAACTPAAKAPVTQAVTISAEAHNTHSNPAPDRIPAINPPRLYDAASGKPLPLIRNGFEHL